MLLSQSVHFKDIVFTPVLPYGPEKEFTHLLYGNKRSHLLYRVTEITGNNASEVSWVIPACGK